MEPYTPTDAEIDRVRDQFRRGTATPADGWSALFYAVYCWGKALFALLALIPLGFVLYLCYLVYRFLQTGT